MHRTERGPSTGLRVFPVSARRLSSTPITFKPYPAAPSQVSIPSTRDKRHRCPNCDHGFTRSYDLTRHLQGHTGEKPHVCQFPGCEKRYSRRDTLQKHHRTHQSSSSHTADPLTRLEVQTSASSHSISQLSLFPSISASGILTVQAPATHSVSPFPELVDATSQLHHERIQVGFDSPLIITPQNWNKDTYRQILTYRGPAAQFLIDCIQQVLYTSSPHSVDKVHQLAFLGRLSKASDLLPCTFYLKDIEDVRCITELSTQSTDVFQGTHHGRKVFLKRYRVYDRSVTRKDRTELLKREAIVWASHQHAGILPFLGVFQRAEDALDSGLYLVSPFLEHGTIVSYLESQPTVNRCLLMRDIFGAMAFLHSNDIIHGDIKGANVLVDSSGHACVSDLGFSRLISPDVLTWTSVRSVATVATVPWQAPELLRCLLEESAGGSENRGKKTVKPTKKADVYSIGCFAYEVFTNTAPFWDVSPGNFARLVHIVTAVVADKRQPTRPEPLSNAYSLCGLTDELWCMMESCWAREPSLRPTTCQLSELPCFKDLVDNRPPRET
ncbi:hypothetical protein NMY22_g5296 [Coprinellus aureogranulatus]|nr:hypothetical protein NMY22_g5296 [Coprinellus aureogranulatus]